MEMKKRLSTWAYPATTGTLFASNVPTPVSWKTVVPNVILTHRSLQLGHVIGVSTGRGGATGRQRVRVNFCFIFLIVVGSKSVTLPRHNTHVSACTLHHTQYGDRRRMCSSRSRSPICCRSCICAPASPNACAGRDGSIRAPNTGPSYVRSPGHSVYSDFRSIVRESKTLKAASPHVLPNTANAL